MKAYAKKPLVGREGANITLFDGTNEWAQPGDYDTGDWIYQDLAPLPLFDDRYAMVGSWVIDGTARGMGIRESNGPITTNTSSFVPHLFD